MSRVLRIFASGLFLVIAFHPEVFAGSVTFDPNADPNTESARCLRAGDLVCMVDVWANQFKLKPYDDTVRQEYWSALMIESYRSLDSGSLYTAKTAYQQAKELIPTGPNYDYFETTFSSLGRALLIENMEDKRDFTEVHRTDFEAQYVDIPDQLGIKTSALALTEKQANYFTGYSSINYPTAKNQDIDYRAMIFPTSRNGQVYLIFGVQPDGSYFALELDFSYGYSAAAGIAHYSPSSGWENLSEIQYLTVDVNKWHSIEVRVMGQSASAYVDHALVTQQAVFNYKPGKVGIEVGLSSYSTASTFSSAFDDIVIYSLKDE